MADDENVTSQDLFMTLMASGNEVKIISAQRLRDCGVPVDPDWHQDMIFLAFYGQMFGVEINDGRAIGCARALLTAENSATLAAIAIVYGEQVMGKIAYTAAFDRELARVRHTKAQEEQAK